MNIAISQDFLDCLSRAPAPIAKKARETISKFRIAPTSSGLNYERINGTKDKNIRSLRIDQDWRAILWASPEGGNHIFLWLDHHDDAYSWSRNRRVEINPEIGALQIYEVTESEERAHAVDEGKIEQGLYSHLRDRELMRLGVPEELIPVVRTIQNDNDLEAMEEKLPSLAFQGLFLIAAGYSYEEAVGAFERDEIKPVSQDDAALLTSPESRSMFFLVENDQVLEEMFNAPLERWRVFLHPSQRRIVEKDWNGPVKITGGPGTGKTVVALHRAKCLASRLSSNTTKKILVTTFTKNLTHDLNTLLERICTTEELEKIEVKNIDSVARDILRRNNFSQTIMFEGSTDIEDLWNEALSESDTDDFPRDFYRQEWEEVIQPQQIRDLESYKAASRAGRKTRLTRPQLMQIWPVFENYLSALRDHGWIESQDAFFAAAQFVDTADRPYCAVIVDETQDMGNPALTLIRSLADEGQNDLFLVGDAHQTLYSRKTILSRAGIMVRGRSRKLLLNYRTTEQIGKWATQLLQGITVDDMDGEVDTLKGYRALVSGPDPVDLRSLVPEEKLTKIREILTQMDESQRSSTCLALPSQDAVHEWKKNLKSWGIEAEIIDKNSDITSKKSSVNIATIHRIKGLEFDTVVVKLPSEDMRNAKALGFVAATRARKELVIL